MFIFTLLVALFAVLSLIMIPLILMQKGKSSMGFGSLGGSSQLLFGGSGGQDLFQKVTWGMLTVFMAGSLLLAMMKRPTQSRAIGSIAQQAAAPVPSIPVPSAQPPAQQ